MSNKEIIAGLVEKHFSLNERSVSIFKGNLSENKSDGFIRGLVGKDLRARFDLPKSELEEFDAGWKFFNETYKSFLKENRVDYDDFVNGRTKKEEKLFKNITKFYVKYRELFASDFKIMTSTAKEISDDIIDSYLKGYSEKVGTLKMPKGKMSLVISANFEDWFLCSTGEKWTSCLSLNSNYAEAYWSGLPGTIVDSNRVMIYLTDNVGKDFYGIKTDRFIGRCWALLDSKDKFNISKFYPVNSLSNDLISKVCGINVKDIDPTFEAKNPFIPLRNKNDYTVFIYIDKGQLKHLGGEEYTIIGSENRGGMFGYNSQHVVSDGTIINYTDGILGLIANNDKLENHYEPIYVCENCGVGLTEDEFHYGPDGNIYCNDCFNENFFYCSVCGDAHYNSKINYVNNKYGDIDYVCERCFESDAVKICENCGEAFYATEEHKCH